MTIQHLVTRIALAFGIGLLIGLERGWSTREVRAGMRAAGVRTFAIIGLMGGLVGALALEPGASLTLGGDILLGAAFVMFAGMVTVFAHDENQAAGKFSATTAIAAVLTFILGTYALIGDVRIAAGAAVVAAALLIFRQGLHAWVAHITRLEFQSALLLLAMTFIALPIVPNRSMGPAGGVNLREVWIIAIALAAVSFAGYIAVRLLGERRGILISAAAGGLVSSTAVTFANAKRARAGEGSNSLLVAGATLATAVSFIRVAAIVAALTPDLALRTGPALLAGAVVAVAFAMLVVYRAPHHSAGPPSVAFRNPFGFWSVVGFAFSMGVLIVVARLVSQRFGTTGALTAAATMGLVDVDSMTVSVARLVPDTVNLRMAAYAILLGVATNTCSKVAIGVVIGRGSFALQVAGAAVACVLAGYLTLWITLEFLPT